MADLSLSFCGVELRNPIVAAPAGITETADRLKRCDDAGCGAGVIKSYFQYEPARHSPTPRFHVLHHKLGRHRSFALYSFEQANVYGLEEFGEQIRLATESCEMPIFSSINCNTPDRWEEAAAVSAQAGARAIELNVSCPHGTHIMAHSPMLQTMIDAVNAARAGAGDVPVIPKVTGQLDNPAAVVHALAQAGAGGVVMFNRFTGLDIDLETEAPIMHGGYAGHGGPWAIHYVMRWISDVYPTLPIPIAASGGVRSGGDAAKLILCGATIVEVCTAIVMEGYGVVGSILKDLTDWMEARGHKTLADFRGAVCPKIKGNDDIQRAQDRVAEVDGSKCTNCGLCARVCIYDAVSPEGGSHRVHPEACAGCGLCVQMCPVEAIGMRRLPRPIGFQLGVK